MIGQNGLTAQSLKTRACNKNLMAVGNVFSSNSVRTGLAWVLLLAMAVAATTAVQKAKKDAEPWLNPVVTQDEVAATEWIKSNTAPRTVFATGIFEGELVMGKTRREGTLGGDWAIVPDVIDRMSDVQYRIFGANSSTQAWQTAVKYGAAYVWVPNRQMFAGYEWKYPADVFDNATYFQKVYDKGVRIYRVKDAASSE